MTFTENFKHTKARASQHSTTASAGPSARAPGLGQGSVPGAGKAFDLLADTLSTPELRSQDLPSPQELPHQ